MQGTKKHTNRLIDETSPYLLQHAHNPVDWFAWGEEAFEKARSEDKPILISIGYSACHWCHVMEHESFEDEETALLMNDNFVNIKIDMEERPDVDKIYMNFVQLTTGSGGWPLNVFLTPDKIPFFGGTYFPPEPRYNMPAFKQILLSVSDAWREKRDDLLHSANDILGELRRVGLAEFAGESLSPDGLDAAFQSFVRTFDAANGGFGGAPKFPPSMSLEFLLRYYQRTGNENALEMVTKTCQKMAHGGIFDQLGGGFHRYTVDAIWLTPHFEKMLYDNAQLIRIFLELFQITKDEFYRRIVIETLDYVKREMLDAKGGFYSAQDADSEGVEGKFFVWTPDEVEELLGTDDAKVFNFFYDVSEDGNFEEKNILNIRNTVSETAAALETDVETVTAVLERARRILFDVRAKRVKPFRDEKVLTAWNGLMLGAFARSAAILNDPDYLRIARQNADFIIENMRGGDGRLLRTFKEGQAKLNAYLEDYANFADGLIELFQVSGEERYLREAVRITDLMIEEFWDEDDGGFFFTGKTHEELIVRTKDYYDGASPSGNSVAADLLLKLSHLTGNEKYKRFATTVLRLIAPQIRQSPRGFGRALSAWADYHGSVKEIVIIGPHGNELERALWSEYIPTKVVVKVADDNGDDELIPLLKDRRMIDGRPTAFVCENFTCQMPVTEAADMLDQIS